MTEQEICNVRKEIDEYFRESYKNKCVGLKE